MFARTSRSLLRPILRDIPKHTPIRTRASLHIQAAPSPRPRATAATPSLLFRHRRRQQRTLHVLSTTADPSRPDLYYHLTQLPETEEPAYLLSLLSQLPDAAAHPDAPAVIGVLPAAASEGAEGQEEAGLNDFRENPRFRETLHEAVARALDEEVDEVLVNGAIQTGQGWMHIHDERNPPPLGRIGEPEDIIGSVRVEEGKVVKGTYQPMPAYRVVSAQGVTALTPGVARVFEEIVLRKA